jgi:hypothetical protein
VLNEHTNMKEHTMLTAVLARAFFIVSAFFVWRPFYGMQIGRSSVKA